MADQPKKRSDAGGAALADDHGVEIYGGEIPSQPRIGTAMITGNTFALKAVQYVDVNGMAVVEGDIALGNVSDVDAATTRMREAVQQGAAFGVGITGDQFRWPNCQVPYQIDPNLPNQQRVTDAIAHWEARTGIRFVVRTTESNWVFFTDAGGCWSLVGMRGGQQTISLGAGCGTGNAIHEIGHTVGLWHEQSREDRDQFVTIEWQNIQSGMESQFAQHITDGDDLGAYDYGSIMHYPRDAFSSNGQDTIVPVDPNSQIGQRTALSADDVAAVQAMYPLCHTVTKHPWTDPHVKVVADPPRFKKIIDEPVFKIILDPRKAPGDPGPIKAGLDVRPTGIGTVVNPGFLSGGLLPFTMTTPHHAVIAGAADPTGHSAASLADALQVHYFEIEAAIGRAQAVAAETGLELAKLQNARDAIASAYQQIITGV